MKLDVWVAVVADDRPDLASQAIAGKLNRYKCSRCGHSSKSRTGFLYIDIAKEIAIYIQNTTAGPQEFMPTVHRLFVSALGGLSATKISALRDRLQIAKNAEELSDLVERDIDNEDAEEKLKMEKAFETRRALDEMVPAERLERIVELFLAGEPVPMLPSDADEPLFSLAKEALERAKAEKKDERAKILDGVCHILTNFRGEKSGTSFNLSQATGEFLNAESLEEVQTVLEANPEVYSERSIADVLQVVEVLRDRPAQLETLAKKLQLLRRCQEIGLGPAIREEASSWTDESKRPEPQFQSPLERLDHYVATLTNSGMLVGRNEDATDEFLSLIESEIDNAALSHDRTRVVALRTLRGSLLEVYYDATVPKFVSAAAKYQARECLENHPRLLNKEASAAIDKLLDKMANSFSKRDMEFVREQFELLAHCREHGIGDTFKDPAQRVVDSIAQSDPKADLPAGLQEFLAASTPADHHQLLDRHPDLSSPEVEAMLSEFAQPDVESSLRQFVYQKLAILRLWRDQGTAASNHLAAVEAVLREYTEAGSFEEARQAIENHPELVSDEILDHLTRLIELQIDPRAQRSLQFRLALLERCRELGVEAAFESLDKPETQQQGASSSEDESASSEINSQVVEAFRASEDFSRTKDPRFLEHAIQLWQSAIHNPEFGNLEPIFRAYVFNSHGHSCMDRYGVSKNNVDLDSAVEAFSKAVDTAPRDHDDFAGFLSNLSLALKQRFQIGRSPLDLDRVIGVYELSIEMSPVERPDLSNKLNSLGLRYRDRYELNAHVEDLEHALKNFHKALALEPASMHPMILHNLGLVLHDRFKELADRADLDASIDSFEKSLATADSTERSRYVTGLGLALKSRFEEDQAVQDMQAAIMVLEETIAVPGSVDSEMRDWLTELGHWYLRRNRHIGDIQDLDRAVDTFSLVIKQHNPPLDDWFGYLANLGTALMQRFEQLGEWSDMDEAIRLFEQAIQLVTTSRREYPLLLNNTTMAYSRRYERFGRVSDLDRAITLCEFATASGDLDLSAASMCLNTLAVLLGHRFRATGDPNDLERRMSLLERAMTTAKSDTVAVVSVNLAESMRDRYLASGSLDDVERAVQTIKDAIRKIPETSPDRAALSSSLGLTLIDRYSHTGDLSDLHDSIDAYETALVLMRRTNPGFATLTSNFGFALTRRFRRTGSLQDLERAIELCEESVKVTPDSATPLSGRLNHLGVALRTQYDETKDVELLTKAIDVLNRCIDCTVANDPHRFQYLTNLATAFFRRYEQKQDVTDLRQAVSVHERAVECMPQAASASSGILNNLALALRSLFEQTGNEGDLQNAVTMFEKAATLGSQIGGEIGTFSAVNWGVWALHRESWAEAAKAFDYAQQGFEKVVGVQLLRASKENWLKDAKGVAACAAYAFAKCSDFHKSAVAIEQGQGRMLAEALGRDSVHLESLSAVAPELHDRFIGNRQRLRDLERSEMALEGIESGSGNVGQDRQAWRSARQDLSNVVSEIRRVPGFEHFLQSATFSEITACCANAPLVYLTTTPVGGLALIVRGEPHGDATPIWLPEFTDTTLSDALLTVDDEFREATEAGMPESELGELQQDAVGGYWGAYHLWRSQPQSESCRQMWLNSLDELTEWLWPVAIGPIIQYLESEGIRQATVIPQGLVGLLPVHAAWTRDQQMAAGRKYALDCVAFNYAPNAKALAAARHVAKRAQCDGILAVDEPLATRAVPLPNSSREVGSAVKKFSRKHILRHDAATREAVLRLLADYEVLHLSCHGYANVTDPLNSGLLMANGDLLSLRDLFAIDVPTARLAVLSACETGIRGLTLPDEVVSLPSGFLQAGFAGVLASYWSVADATTAMLMEKFYELWREDGLEPVFAIRGAQQWLRDTLSRKAVCEKRRNIVPHSTMAESIVSTSTTAEKLNIEHPFWWAAFYLTGE